MVYECECGHDYTDHRLDAVLSKVASNAEYVCNKCKCRIDVRLADIQMKQCEESAAQPQ